MFVVLHLTTTENTPTILCLANHCCGYFNHDAVYCNMEIMPANDNTPADVPHWNQCPCIINLLQLYRPELLCIQGCIHVGWGNSTVVSVSVYQAGDPGSRSPQSACHRKVEFYHCVIDSLPPVLATGSKKAIHVLLCLCNNACKRSLVICRKSRALCPVSRLLSVPI